MAWRIWTWARAAGLRIKSGRREVPVEVHPADTGTLGEMVLRLADRTQSAEWVKQRTELIRLTTDRSISYEVTFFLDLSDLSLADVPLCRPETVLLPILRLSRRNRVVTKVRTAGAGELMQVTEAFERELVIAGLQRKWRDRVAPDTPARWEKFLREPINRWPLIARVAARLLYKSLRRGDPALFEAVGVVARDRDPNEIGELLQDLKRWRDNYLLLVEVPVACLHQGTLVLTVEYMGLSPRQHVFSGGHLNLQVALAMLRKVVAGSMSYPLWLEVRSAVGTAQSVDFLVEAPPGFRLVDPTVHVELRPRRPARPPMPRTWLGRSGRALRNALRGVFEFLREHVGGPPRPSRVELWYRDDVRSPERAHINVPLPPVPVERADLFVSFYAYRSGFFFESLAASWVMLGVLAAFFREVVLLKYQVIGSTLNASDAAPVILLLPAAIVTLVTQRESHRVASRVFVWPRVFLAASGVAIIGAAVMLAIPVQPDIARVWWPVTFWITAAVAMRMTLGAMVHLWRVSRFREWLYRNRNTVRDAAQRADLDLQLRQREVG